MNSTDQIQIQPSSTAHHVATVPSRVAKLNLARLLKPPEVAEALAISTRLLWSLTNRGDIPSLRIGKTVRYEPKDIEAWIQRQKMRRRPGVY